MHGRTAAATLAPGDSREQNQDADYDAKERESDAAIRDSSQISPFKALLHGVRRTPLRRHPPCATQAMSSRCRPPASRFSGLPAQPRGVTGTAIAVHPFAPGRQDAILPFVASASNRSVRHATTVSEAGNATAICPVADARTVLAAVLPLHVALTRTEARLPKPAPPILSGETARSVMLGLLRLAATTAPDENNAAGAERVNATAQRVRERFIMLVLRIPDSKSSVRARRSSAWTLGCAPQIGGSMSVRSRRSSASRLALTPRRRRAFFTCVRTVCVEITNSSAIWCVCSPSP